MREIPEGGGGVLFYKSWEQAWNQYKARCFSTPCRSSLYAHTIVFIVVKA